MKALLIDQNYCVGCFACQAACALEHNLSIEKAFIKVAEEESLVNLNGRPTLSFKVSVSRGCDLCGTRLPQRKMTACEQHCVSRCILSGRKDVLEPRIGEMERPAWFVPGKALQPA